MMNGGYLMVSKTDTNLYEKLNKALILGKPVLWYEDENTCYYIDTITKSGTDIILTKGSKIITIESDGDITESGDIQTHLYLYHINDSDCHTYINSNVKINNFIVQPDDTELTDNQKEGLTKIYELCKKCGTSLSLSMTSTDSSWLPFVVNISCTSNNLQIVFKCYDNGDNKELIATYSFGVVDDKVESITTIVDTDIADGLNINCFQLF